MHQHQYSPTAHNVFEYTHYSLFRYFITEQGTSSLVKIPYTIESCDTIPTDIYPIKICPNNFFKFYSQHKPILSNPTQLQDFDDYIQSMTRWIFWLIQHYTVHSSSDSLLYHICHQSQLLISTDSSRTHNKSGGSWIIALTDVNQLVSGHNPEFGRHVDIKSYHSEICTTFASLTFLECYCD